MNLELSDEQVFLRDAARSALARVSTREVARNGLEDPSVLPDLWPTAVEAGWPGMLVAEEHGGAGLSPFDAMLVAEEIGRALARVPFLGVLPALRIFEAAADEALQAATAGDLRPVWVPASPPLAGERSGWEAGTPDGSPGAAISIARDGERLLLTGSAAYVPDAPGCDVLVVIATDDQGTVGAAAVDPTGDGVAIHEVRSYDATRSLGHVQLDKATGRSLECPVHVLADAWHLAQALFAAEAVGTVAAAHEMMLVYAKERFTFGRAIGSYQAVKHEIVEVLRQLENARSLLYYAGWAGERKPDEFALAAAAFRTLAGEALDLASRANINVHGGIGATWEHDAPLFFRRAQVNRQLLGGQGQAAERVAQELMTAADASISPAQ